MTVPFGQSLDEEYDYEKLKSNFLKLYEARYGYTSNDPIECVNFRLIAYGVVPKVSLKSRKEANQQESKAGDAIKGTRRAYFSEAGGFVEATIYDRYKLFEGAAFEGPAIVEEKESTCVVLPGQRVTVDAYSNLIVEEQ